jgi:hypothetical protein
MLVEVGGFRSLRQSSKMQVLRLRGASVGTEGERRFLEGWRLADPSSISLTLGSDSGILETLRGVTPGVCVCSPGPGR